VAKTQDYAVRWDSASLEGFPFAVRLRLTNATFGETELLPYKLNASLVTMQTPAWESTLVDFTVQDLTGSGPLAGLRIDNVDGQVMLPGFSERHEHSLGLNVFAAQLRLPEAPRPLSSSIHSAQVMAEFNGTVLQAAWREALLIWRDNGGSIDSLSIELKWDAVELSILNDGILKLDQTLQPTGSFRVA
jgi:hypothetical protein